MNSKPSAVSLVLLALVMLVTGAAGFVGGIFASVHLGLALHGQYDYSATGHPLGYFILATDTVLGAAAPLAIRALVRKLRGAA